MSALKPLGELENSAEFVARHIGPHEVVVTGSVGIALYPVDGGDFETLAQQMHFSPSTLRRHLIDEGQSYQSIKDALRLDLAISQLCHSDKSVEGIALDLGFAEASAFHRAFKKWTGTRPGEYRRALAGQ